MGTILHAIAGDFALLLTVRVLTRRPGGQLTLFEFVLVFLIGGVAIAATVGQDHSATNCVVAIITIGLLHGLMAWATGRSARFAAVLDGTPLVLLKDGHWQQQVMTGRRIDPEDLMAAARSKQVRSIFDVKYAILERNSTISIITDEK